MEAAALEGFDRHLAYGMFGAKVISDTMGWKEACDWMPHGLNMDVFQPRDKTGTRIGMEIPKDNYVIGVVMTNQTRKDWGLAFEIIKLVAERCSSHLTVWCKTDSIDRYWDFRALITDFGLGDMVRLDLTALNDTELSYMYSMCDLTFLPSLGEGFGYPIVESMACGVPCITGGYGGGAELLPSDRYKVEPCAYRYESAFNCLRPVYRAADWADVISRELVRLPSAEDCRMQVDYLNWPNLSTVWTRWFREGLHD
jgi:glycosyltransferase involved in cell wall biosynthesis